MAALKQEPVADSPKFLKVACELARRYEIPEDVFLRLIMKEVKMGRGGPFEPRRHRIDAAYACKRHGLLASTPTTQSRTLRAVHATLPNSIASSGHGGLAVAAYNAGPYTVKKYGDVPPFPETQRYVREVLGQV